jgi:uncharacterized RDD family membrane protein YckC
MADVPACPLCHDDARMKRPKVLYGHQVCRRCWGRFMGRRQLAWLLDFFLVCVIFMSLELMVLPVHSGSSKEGTGRPWDDLALLVPLAFAFKDGIAGQSPGKVLFGVQTVHRDTGEPAGFGRSFLRNWFALIPLMALIIWITMGEGPRLGDGIARTRAIWKRYRDHPVFSPPAAVARVFE